VWHKGLTKQVRLSGRNWMTYLLLFSLLLLLLPSWRVIRSGIL
jgi:hypothetical protein